MSAQYPKRYRESSHCGPFRAEDPKTAHVNSCVLNNGYASEFFSLGRGVRQGCPLSGLLFVIGIEILARAIKNDAGIKGIKVGEKEI